ncbi:hypothetical protein E0Z10_g2974 [Xylaria hypoxylon]|uniref:Protein kinase domain-containing protein n=1 Tax=Xylaria hypoxylon TaxID=37992 RepID=A0A4Z0Z212_9PEZI|nr:hypothetical protein E0Z10_g2974 [Xylaria hypoxylon]
MSDQPGQSGLPGSVMASASSTNTTHPLHPRQLGFDEGLIGHSENNTNFNTSGRFGTPDDDNVDTIEKAMGRLLESAQQQTGFPLDTRGAEQSASVTYDVSAELSVHIRSTWKLLQGFELTGIKLSLAVQKTTHSSASIMIVLEAQMKIGEVDVKVKGKIPHLEEGQDTDFVLTLEAKYGLQSIPLDKFLAQTSQGDIPIDSIKGAIEQDVAEQISLSGAGGYAASASLVITRLAATQTYQVKQFEVRVLGFFDWDVIKDKIRLRKASMAVIAKRKAPDQKLDWTLKLLGSLLIKGPTKVDFSGQLVIENGACTGLSANITVGNLKGVKMSTLLDAVAGEGTSSEAQKGYEPPPLLHIPHESSSLPLTLLMAIAKKPSGWYLSKAEISLFLDDIGWSPLDGITLESLLFSLKVYQNPQSSVTPPSAGNFKYAACFGGVFRIFDLPLRAEVAYNSEHKILTIQATVADDAILSLQNMCDGWSEKITPALGQNYNPKYDLEPIVDRSKEPNGCPVYIDWAMHGNLVSDRQCVILLRDSKLERVSFSATYQGPQFTWKLSEGLRIIDAGLFIDADFRSPASTSDPSINAFVYGQISLSKNTTLLGFAAVSNRLDRKRFDVLLTVHRQPDASLGLPPKEVINDKLLVGRDINTNGWSLPSSTPKDWSLENSITSTKATVKASFMSEAADKPTVLTAVAARLAVSGTWKILSNLELKDIAFGILAARKEASPSTPFNLLASIYGRARVAIDASNFDIWCHALIEKKESLSKFTAVLTVCTADSAKEPPPSSQLTPSQLTKLDFIGKFPLVVAPEQEPPAECPGNFDTLVNSTSANCELHVTKQGETEGWVLSEVTFSLEASGRWVLIPEKLVLNAGSLFIAVLSPGDISKRAIEAYFAAKMTIGVSTIVDAHLTFTRSQNKKLISGLLSTDSSSGVKVKQMANELLPQQSGDATTRGLQEIGVQMINRNLIIQDLVSYLTLAEGGSDNANLQQTASPLTLLRLLDQKSTLEAGGWVLGKVDLKGTGTMTNTLALAASPISIPQITFYVNIRAAVASMDCSLHLTNFGLFGDSLVLNGSVVYHPSSPNINGSVVLTLPDLSSYMKPQIVAAVFMQSDETKISAKVAANEKANIENPFDLMYNTSFAIGEITGRFQKPQGGEKPPTSTVTISGSLRLGPPTSSWVVTASVIFLNGKARIIRGGIGTTRTDILSSNLLKPAAPNTVEGGEWPSDLPVLDFQSAYIYYARSIKPDEDPLVIDHVTYRFGYCIAATFTLFGAPFTVSALLPENRSGMHIIGTYENVIDLVFAKLYGYEHEGKHLPSPSVIIDTTSNRRVYTATTGIEVFGIRGYKIELFYQSTPSKSRFEGTIQYQGSLLGISSPSISLAYDDGHLFVAGWPFKRNGEDVDKDYLQNAIREGSKKVDCDKCEDLVKLVLDKLIQTEFDFSLSKPKDGRNPVSGKTYIGCVKWSYVVSVTIPGTGKKEIGRLDMEPSNLTIDKGFTTQSIWEALFTLLAKNMVEVGKAILSDPPKFAMLIGMMNMKGVAAELLSSLLCRGVDEDNVKEAANKTLDDKKNEPSEGASAVEKAFEAIADAKSFADAVLSFGGGVIKFVVFLALAVIFGPVASLGKRLLPLLFDPVRKGFVESLLSQYEQLRASCEQAQQKAEKQLTDLARLSAPPTTSWLLDTATESSILVDWSKSLPKPPPNTPGNYFGDFGAFSWDVAWGWVDDPGKAYGTISLDPGQDRTYAIVEAALLQQRVVYTWVRTKFTLNKKTMISAWSPPGPPLTHALYLPAPKGISISISNGPAFDTMDVNITEPQRTRYLAAFADNEESITDSSYKTELNDGTGKAAVPVIGLNVNDGDVGPLKGFVRELTTDRTMFRDSPWTPSHTGLQVVREDLGFTIKEFDLDAVLEWNSLGATPSAFSYVVTGPNGSAVTPTVVEQTTVGDRISTRLRSPSFGNGSSIVFALRRIPVAPNVLHVFTKMTLTFRTLLTISPESFVDTETQSLELYVKSIPTLTLGQQVMVKLYTEEGPEQVRPRIKFLDPIKQLAKLTVVYPEYLFPLKADVTIRVRVDSGEVAVTTPQWDLSHATSAPFAMNFHTYFDNEKNLRVYWETGGSPVVSCRMDLASLNEDLLVRGKDLPHVEFQGRYSAVLTKENLDAFQGNKSARVQIWCTSVKGTFKTKEKVCWLPDLKLWTTPDKCINKSLAATNSSLSSMYTAHYSVNKRLGAIWWMAPDGGMIEGNVRTDEDDNWNSDGLSATSGGNLAPLNSSITSCTQNSEHQEVFWIDQHGGIRGMRQLNTDVFRDPGGYTFSEPGTASTARGGSLTVVTCAQGIMDLWFVSPKGELRYAQWNGKEWGVPMTVASGLDARDDAISFLTACGTRVGEVDLFWIQEIEAKWTIQNLRGTNMANRPTYSAQLVTNEGEPAPNSKPHAFYSMFTGTTSVAWITTSGAVKLAMARATSGDGGQPNWTATWTVSPEHTASPYSRICSGTWGAGVEMPSLFWIDEKGCIMVAQYDSQNLSVMKYPRCGYWASYWHDANNGCQDETSKAPMEIVVCSGTRTSVRLFWIHVDGGLRTMRYPKEGALPWPPDNNVILGQELNKFRADSPIGLQLNWSRRWPDAPFIRYLSIAGREALVVNNLAAHKAVLQTHVYDFVKPPFFARLVGEITGVGLLFAEGEEHRHQRRLLAGPFSIPSMRKILPVFQRKAKALSKDFETALRGRSYASIEVIDTLSKSAMDTIGLTVLGVELDTLSSIYPLSFQELYSRVLHQGPVGQLISAINAFVPIRRFVPLGANRRFIHATENLRKMLRDIIEKRKADLGDETLKKEIRESRDLLTYILEESELQRQQTGREPWTTEAIIGHLLNFTSAGHESTANSLSWALYVLSTRHEIQDQLRAEVQEVRESSAKPTYDEINGLPYLHNFVREVLRVYTPSIMSPRQASKDLVIEGVYIPKGTQVDLHMPLIHHHEGVWGPDASVFRPERWNNLTGDSASPYAFQAFIQGPRICPGKNFAVAEIKSMLIELVSKWRFIGIERSANLVGKDESDEGRERELLVNGEEAIGKGIKLANPTLTYRPAGGLYKLHGAKHIIQILASCPDLVAAANDPERRNRFSTLLDNTISRFGILSRVPPITAFDTLVGVQGPALALEYLDGGDLLHFIRESIGERPPNRVLWSLFLCLVRACIGMAYPIERPIGAPLILETIPNDGRRELDLVHSDIAPRNVMIGPEDGLEEHGTGQSLKLIDFGAAFEFGGATGGSANNIENIAEIMANVLDFLPMEKQVITWEGYETRAGVILPKYGFDPCPMIDMELRTLIARCMSVNPSRRPTLEEALEQATNAVSTKTPNSFPDPEMETDRAIREYWQEVTYDARLFS